MIIISKVKSSSSVAEIKRGSLSAELDIRSGAAFNFCIGPCVEMNTDTERGRPVKGK